jgi:DNA-binding transcriptional ArsR family regulator
MSHDIQKVKNCACEEIHEELVNKAKETMPEDETLYDLAELFKVFGDTTRIKILYALFASEMCVCDIADLLGMTHSAISHQLRVLKNARLVKFRKEGKVVYYSLDDNHISQIFDCGLAHIQESCKR